ncbi:MAG: hypothetical protein JSS72_05685 [Armatimonadetes bacterium]|nr:hypothetical protein [Armatimonadota bacterium]
MAAQVPEKKFNVCDRCFATIPVGKSFCPECGAPIAVATEESSDQAVYTELSRANLLRMRGEYKKAEDQCLQILKRFPNNASANTLLGDIAAEQNDFSQAINWYELALDLTPDSAALKGKLEGARSRVHEMEAVETAKQLGIPMSRNRVNAYIVSVLALILLVAAAAYYLGAKQKAHNTGPASLVANPVSVGGDNPPPADNPGPGNRAIGDPSPAGEGHLLQRLASATPEASKVVAMMQDPRDKRMTLVFVAGDPAETRGTAARLARASLDLFSDAVMITVRGMHQGQLVYTSDVLRATLNETNTSIWTNDHKDQPNAWIDHILGNEWSANPAKGRPGLDDEKDGPPADTAGSPSGGQAPDPSGKSPDTTKGDGSDQGGTSGTGNGSTPTSGAGSTTTGSSSGSTGGSGGG